MNSLYQKEILQSVYTLKNWLKNDHFKLIQSLSYVRGLLAQS